MTSERLRYRAEGFHLARRSGGLGGSHHLISKGVRLVDELAILLPDEVLKRRPQRRLVRTGGRQTQTEHEQLAL
mgnify:CR=1 FL=1